MRATEEGQRPRDSNAVVTKHALERAAQIYGGWLDKRAMCRALWLLCHGRYVARHHSAAVDREIFDVVVQGVKVRLLATPTPVHPGWCIVTVLPPEFKNKRRLDSRKHERRDFFRHGHFEEEEGLESEVSEGGYAG